MRISDQPGYVLKRQDYGDTSLLVDVFTHDYGRLRLIAKGARAGKTNKARALQPFQKLNLGWVGRSDLKTLTQIESLSTRILGKDSMACAFYISELIWNFLEVQDPHEVLFESYGNTLNAFAEGVDLEPLLRNFEFLLLDEIGYGCSFDVDADTGEPIVPQKHYIYRLGKGLVSAGDGDESVSGARFLAVANREFIEKETLVLAKRLTRKIIHHCLDGRELHSRKWFRQTTKPDAQQPAAQLTDG